MILSRSEELNFLNRYYNQAESGVLVLYGPENVGLTSLWKEFSKGKTSVCLNALECSERQQRYLWRNRIQSMGKSALDEYPLYAEIFETILEVPKSDKLILVIEDFENAVRCSKDFIVDLFSFIRQNKTDNSIFCLLCSHHIGWVENQFVSQIGKNAFSISGFMKVHELHFLDLLCYYDSKDTSKCMDFYSLLGGRPGSWAHFDPNDSLKNNIISQFIKPDGHFHRIGLDVLNTYLREPAVYSTILFALATGKCKLNDLYLHTGFSRPKISVYLKTMMNLEIVEKVYSFETAGDENTKKGVYRITDPRVLFWYRFIYSNWEDISMISAEEFYDKYIAPNLLQFIGERYTGIVSEYMCLLNKKKLLPIEFIKYGEWVGKNGTIHFVAKDAQRNVITGYCVFDKSIMAYEDYEWFLFCLEQAHLKPRYCYFFALDGFDDKMKLLPEQTDRIKLIEIKEL